MNDDDQMNSNDSSDMGGQDRDDAGSKGGQSSRVNAVQIQKFIQGIDYPASREDLVEHAREHGADDRVISKLESLPDEQFNTPADVSQAVGKNE